MHTNSHNVITTENLIDAGYIKDGCIWISPYSGNCLSFEEARHECLHHDHAED